MNYLDLFREKLLEDPTVVEVAGELCRAPSVNPNGEDMVFYEPCCTSVWIPRAQQVELIAHLDKHLTLQPGEGVRVPTTSVGNASFDYNEILVNDWPNHQPDRSWSKNPSKYNQTRRQADFAANLRAASQQESLEVIRKVLVEGSLLDQTTIFAWLNQIEKGRFGHFYWASLDDANGRYATYLLSEIVFQGKLTLVDCLIDLAPRALAGPAHWHLIDQTYHQFSRYDFWNVGLTDRERYKRVFFTGKTQQPCWYKGHNPYSWLHT